MKKSKFKKIVIIILAVLVILVLCMYAFLSSIIKGKKIQVMDFNQPLNIKKAEQPINTNPAILFLGNSMTFHNDLPSTFLNLSQSGGFNPDVYEITEGKYMLSNFADETDELGAQVYDALENYSWDYVIMQEHTGIANVAAEKMMFPAARTLDAMARISGGESVFLMTWAGKEGLGFNLAGLKIKSTREEEQTRMAQNYMSISNELNAMLAPAGIAFMRCASRYPEIELWDEDKQHPSPEGTYLTACVLYKVLYNQSPEGLDYLADLEGQTVGKLQSIAAGIE